MQVTLFPHITACRWLIRPLKFTPSAPNILYYRGVNKRTKYGYLLVLLCVNFVAGAQIITEDTTSHPPFFAAKKFNSKCYVGFEGTATQILGTKAAMNLGLSLNWVINHRYVVSAKYHVLTTPVNIQKKVAPDYTRDTIRLVEHFAGLGFSYILFDKKKFSFQPELSVGWGAVKYSHQNKTFRKDFGVIIPAVYGVYNATKYFRFGLGFTAKFTAGASLNGLKDADLLGLGGVIFIRVGTF